MNFNYFDVNDFNCPCCGFTKIELSFVKKLDKLRGLIGKPFVVTSGYRCATHNLEVGGVRGSQHTEGLAADIVKQKFDQEDLYRLIHLAGKMGISVGISKSFIHLDVRKGTPVLWVY